MVWGGCLEGMGKVSGGCVEAVWRMLGKLSGGCGVALWRV